MTDASIGYGSAFALGDGATPEVFTAIAEVYLITPPNETADPVEATHMQSPDRRREFIAGLIDPGESSFEMNFLPGSASEDAILAWKTSGANRNCRITFPNGATWTFSAICTGYEPAVPLDDRMTATVSMKVSGSILRTAP